MADTLTIEERRFFHSMDRRLYTVLVRDLCRNPLECLQIMAFWMWMECGCGYNLIKQIMPLQVLIVSRLADEAMACLVCAKGHSPVAFAIGLMPLTLDLFKKGCAFRQFLHKNWHTASGEVQELVKEVCAPVMSDLYEQACCGGYQHSQMGFPIHPASVLPQSLLQASPSPANSMVQRSYGMDSGHSVGPTPGGSGTRPVRRSTTTVFMTFSKGYPVSEQEVSVFCNRLSRNNVQSIKMQAVRRGQQPLFARVVFWSPSCIDEIVAGGNKAKFTINGKHIWIREFEPNNRSSSPE